MVECHAGGAPGHSPDVWTIQNYDQYEPVLPQRLSGEGWWLHRRGPSGLRCQGFIPRGDSPCSIVHFLKKWWEMKLL